MWSARAQTEYPARTEQAQGTEADVAISWQLAINLRDHRRSGEAELDRVLRRQKVVWLSTARPDGRPNLVPIWFLWDGSAFLIFSKPDAQKVRNLRRNPDVMLALGDADRDFDVQLVAGRAELLDRTTHELLPPALVKKYSRQLRALGLSPCEYAETYSQPIRVVPARFLEWRGRSHLEARSGARRASWSARLAARVRPPSVPPWLLVGGTVWAPIIQDA